MTYGNEQAEARRLRSILEGDVMTDPVAPSTITVTTAGMSNDELGWLRLPEGYVLVNTDMLAEAMGDLTGEDEDGSWAWQPERMSQREFARSLLHVIEDRQDKAVPRG